MINNNISATMIIKIGNAFLDTIITLHTVIGLQIFLT